MKYQITFFKNSSKRIFYIYKSLILYLRIFRLFLQFFKSGTSFSSTRRSGEFSSFSEYLYFSYISILVFIFGVSSRRFWLVLGFGVGSRRDYTKSSCVLIGRNSKRASMGVHTAAYNTPRPNTKLKTTLIIFTIKT